MTRTILSRQVTRLMACRIVHTTYFCGNIVDFRTSEVSQFLGAFAAYVLVYICTSMCTCSDTECRGKAKNTFRINCRAGIPRQCAEQNAATLCNMYKRRKNGKGRLVGRLVGFSGTPEGTERLVKMQTSRFGVDAGRKRNRAGRCAIRCCRFACATSKKLDVDCENGKGGKRREPARERAREGRWEKEESRTTAVKPPYERNSREVRSVRRCNGGWLLRRGRRKKRK